VNAHEPTLLGAVESVSGAAVTVRLLPAAASGLTYVGGHGFRVGQVGNFVRIEIGLLDLFGVISQIGAGAAPQPLTTDEPYGHRWMTIQLVGEAQPGQSFERGLSEYPTVGDSVHLLTEPDLLRLYGETDEVRHVRIGQLAGGSSIPARVNIERLLTRHAAVVGATGSGKSSTVARILTCVIDGARYPSARALLFDLHGEYPRAFPRDATCFSASSTPSRGQQSLWIPFWALPLDTFVELFMGPIAADASRAFLGELVADAKRRALDAHPRPGVDRRVVTADTPVPYSLKDLWLQLHRLEHATHTAAQTGQSDATEALLLDASGQPVERGDAAGVVPPIYKPQVQGSVFLSGRGSQLRRQVDLLGQRLRDPRYGFVLQPGPFEPDPTGRVDQDLDKLLASWVGSSARLAILDLSPAPAALLGTLVGAIVHIVYEALVWGRAQPEGGRERPLLMVFEEAHSYLSSDGGSYAGRQVRRVVREGRKYGLGAVVVSQRPSELDPTVLSQCGTLIALRLANAADRQQVTGVASENFQGLLASLPILRTGEAIILGEAVGMPMRVQVDRLDRDRRPDSGDPAVVADAPHPGGWGRPAPEVRSFEKLVESWRAQDARPSGDGAKAMNRQPVQSTAVVSVGYDPEDQILEVEFTSGMVYQYSGVSASVFDELLGAASFGSYFNQQVRHVYPYSRE
jgi:hypothetical protein